MGKKKRSQRTAEEIRNHNKHGGEYWKKHPKNKGWDAISFEEREAERAKKKKERVYTKSFNTQQKFGPASDVIILDPSAFPEYNEK